jgi:hypothetical protein
MSSHNDKVELKPSQIELKKGTIWTKLHIIGFVLAIVGLGAAYALKGDAEHSNPKFWTSYLNAFMFALALALGGFFFTILQHLVRAGWSIVLRRLAEHMMIALPFVALFGLPILFVGAHEIFEWSHTEVVENDPMLKAKVMFLNEGALRVRYAIYLGLWSVVAGAMWVWSRRQDKLKDEEEIASITRKQRFLAAPALIVFAMSLTFGGFDFMMSLDPHWFSTMFGVYFFCGIALSAFAFLCLISYLLKRSGYLDGVVTVEHFHDLGKYMFGFTVFWTYIAFSQYFLIWYANIPEETYFFSYRGHGGWLTLSLILVFGRFVIPFFALLRRPLKRHPAGLTAMAVFFLVMQYVDLYWLVQPPYAHHRVHQYEHLAEEHADKASEYLDLAHYFHEHVDFGAVDILCLVGFIGVFLIPFGWSLATRALVPVKDPRLAESVNFENF